jgi:hypothetical protein
MIKQITIHRFQLLRKTEKQKIELKFFPPQIFKNKNFQDKTYQQTYP